jgi:3-oxoacyl-[acyl-carrier-protein] synthase II
MDRRVAVTGIGIVSPLGCGREAFGKALLAGETGIAPLTAFPAGGFPSRLAAEIRGFRPKEYISTKNLRRMDRLSAVVTAAARMALDDAGLTVTAANRDRTGMILGTAYGGTDVTVSFSRILVTEGPGSVNPILVPNVVMNAPAGHASIELGFRGINTTVNHYAVSAESALAYGAQEIRRGAADRILAGGADVLSPFFFESLTRFRALSPLQGGGEEGARPFDLRRNGPVAGEGCGILCLEPLEAARERGAPVYAEILGSGMASSPAPMTGWPDDPRGFLLSVRRALSSAGCIPGDVDVVFAAAAGGLQPDLLEAEGLQRIFGNRGKRPLVTALKGATGESFTSGGIRAAALALALRDGAVSPTPGLEEPVRPLAFVTGRAARGVFRRGLLNGISHGGTYVTVLFSRIEE